MKPPRDTRSEGSRSGNPRLGLNKPGGQSRPSGKGPPRNGPQSEFRGNSGQSGAKPHHGSSRNSALGSSQGNSMGNSMGNSQGRSHGGSHSGGFQGGGSQGGGSQGRSSQRGTQGGFQGQRRQHDAPRHGPDAPKGTVWLYGHHAVAAALANPARRLRRLLLTEEAEASLSAALPPPWALSAERTERGRLDHLLGRDVVHQGAALLADTLAPPSLQSVLDKSGPIVVLDQVTDPRNVGAIMRSATAFGAAAVIVQDRNAPEETGALAKAASGALEKMPLLRAVNIARTIIALKAADIWCIGLDANGKPLSGPDFATRRVGLVLGAEGEGLRRLTRETCDEVAGLTIGGAMESLNVSAAAAIALYEISRR
jgi:23S rRNA (guanosine2251-2'-O)-methyltransferase